MKKTLISAGAFGLALMMLLGSATDASAFGPGKFGENLEEIKAAIEANDYDAFLEAAEGARILNRVQTEADFDELVERDEHRQAVKEAISEGDYEEFRDLVGDEGRLSGIDTEDAFELLQEAHELKEAGDREGAREIFAELGIERKGKGFRGR